VTLLFAVLSIFKIQQFMVVEQLSYSQVWHLVPLSCYTIFADAVYVYFNDFKMEFLVQNVMIPNCPFCTWCYVCESTVTSKRLKAAKKDIDNVEALGGLDTLANLAILGEGEALLASSQATTKHPRHRPGCSCIVCIQPPSGKGPKHKQTCTCNVCQTVKRRFKTLMMKREKKQSEKEAETTRKQQESSAEKLLDDDPSPSSNAGSASGSPNKKKAVSEVSDDDPNRMKSSTSPFKGQIDLNIQPEREDELSPGSDSGGMMRMLQDASERYLRMQRFLSSDGDNIPASNHSVSSGGADEKAGSGIMLGGSHQDASEDHPSAFSLIASESASASTPAT
jgi:hypothetical protein